MDKKTKVLVYIVIAALILSVALTFYRTVVRGDFEVINIEVPEEQEEVGTQILPSTETLTPTE